ncbi:MAG: thioredoxin family protein, partial [Pseudomonadota bacterium]
MTDSQTSPWKDGLLAVVKEDCPTCVLIEPVLRALQQENENLTIVVQDNPDFPALDGVIFDEDLRHSYELDIETVPSLIRIQGGAETERTIGWDKSTWQTMSGIDTLGSELPPSRPGCGSKSVEPGMAETLALRFGELQTKSRKIEVSELEDDIEYCFDRGWSDGLPLVPPTEARVYRMLQGTKRDPQEVLGEAPPNLVPCTVEKVAINAVMAGCKHESETSRIDKVTRKKGTELGCIIGTIELYGTGHLNFQSTAQE